MGEPKGFTVDHINGNRLDNRKSNLRICTFSDNLKNRSMQRGNTSGYKGVTFRKKENKWIAQISVKNKTVGLGYYSSAIDAAIAYNNAAILYYGKFARLNNVEETPLCKTQREIAVDGDL